MQDLVDGDNNRTPVKFQGSDIYRFVGGITRLIEQAIGTEWAFGINYGLRLTSTFSTNFRVVVNVDTSGLI